MTSRHWETEFWTLPNWLIDAGETPETLASWTFGETTRRDLLGPSAFQLPKGRKQNGDQNGRAVVSSPCFQVLCVLVWPSYMYVSDILCVFHPNTLFGYALFWYLAFLSLNYVRKYRTGFPGCVAWAIFLCFLCLLLLFVRFWTFHVFCSCHWRVSKSFTPSNPLFFDTLLVWNIHWTFFART